MKNVFKMLLFTTLAFAAGCATVPKESIELSATVGRDLEVVQTANRNLAVMYFEYLLSDVDQFIDDVYRPFIIEFTVDDLNLVGDFQAALEDQHQDGLDALDVLVIYSEEVTAMIDAFRKEMRAPLVAQRDSVLLSIDEAFKQLQTANAVVIGHLSSVVKVHDAQAAIMSDLGLENYRAKVATGLASLSVDINKALIEARKIKEELDSIENDAERIRKTRDELSGLPGKISKATGSSPAPATIESNN